MFPSYLYIHIYLHWNFTIIFYPRWNLKFVIHFIILKLITIFFYIIIDKNCHGIYKAISYMKINVLITLWSKLLHLVETYNLSDRKNNKDSIMITWTHSVSHTYKRYYKVLYPQPQGIWEHYGTDVLDF